MIESGQQRAFSFCVGGAVVSGLGLLWHVAGWGVPWAELSVGFVILFLGVYGGLLWRDAARVWANDALYREKQMVELERQRLALSAPVSAPPVPVARIISYNRNGQRGEMELSETRPARWLAWQTAAERVLAWYALRHSLYADRLTPGAFADRSAWVRYTDALAALGLVVKDRSGTIWAQPFGAIRARIEAGSVDWPDDSDPPKVAPCPAGLQTVDAASSLTQP